jgi:hypothetical protein
MLRILFLVLPPHKKYFIFVISILKGEIIYLPKWHGASLQSVSVHWLKDDSNKKNKFDRRNPKSLFNRVGKIKQKQHDKKQNHF